MRLSARPINATDVERLQTEKLSGRGHFTLATTMAVGIYSTTAGVLLLISSSLAIRLYVYVFHEHDPYTDEQPHSQACS